MGPAGCSVPLLSHAAGPTAQARVCCARAAMAVSGNLVPDDVPVDDDEDHNLVVDTNGTFGSDVEILL